ncbi:conserved hypothetical protein [Gluconacetobacter diazotrophicus PA1 5]|nr:hypothetical protein [Gluconacetobacter diazotrophicus]ACI50964.1 conserved hypothetical protein [Gluconacetobacter diazotrophicus PA1 5]MBB2156102.1 hypothetical protein [Gluconacetobacter diazotrophicus]TWB08581.1 hypothetical protein FBZ86_10678 [Gluconacetobacter diazotrophicus]
MTMSHSRLGASSGNPADIGPWLDRTECASWLDTFLSETAPQRGYGHLLRRAADTGLYDVVRNWSQTPSPFPTDMLTVQLLLPPDLVAEIARETAMTDQDTLAALTTELPLAVRRHSTQKRFNRFGHAGCQGEDPTRR